MILLVDNYDSFTYNLVHLFAGYEVIVCRNDAPDLLAYAAKAQAIVLSPGPGTPDQAGECEALIRLFYQTKPILGICLGHQALGEVFGARVRVAPEIMHGKIVEVSYEATGILAQITGPLEVMRYHSLVVEEATLAPEWVVNARFGELIMSMHHRCYPLYGVQFHPESIGTQQGAQMIATFMQKVEECYASHS